MDARTTAALDRAAEKTRRHIGTPRRAETLGLTLGRTTAPTPMLFVRYPPCLAMVLHGRKHSLDADSGGLDWGPESFLITPVKLPVIARVVETGADGDFVSLNWRLDPAIVAEVAGQLPRPRPGSEATPRRLGTTTAEIADAVDRLVGLLDTPEDAPVLLPLVSRELILRLLQSDQAPRVHAAAEHARADTVSTVIDHFTADLARPWTIDDAAALCHISPATLTRRFRDITGLTPMRYLKRLRLGEARRAMLTDGWTATQAATSVGYLSAAHFSRDYRAAYRLPPARDAQRASVG
ncbi:AraC family transcriptional regulator [Microbacterium invictum]|uniref:AraC family transcriptional regulator n=1 Tax=Microbacterium invictum TaxID=515415 RepID=A0ABZ0VAI3_9MICO|nr:AraC family transcriptional regulator [Microbacterium invictum]WQB69706.1 AraC family transcriptional regulator [Microbacterium invictum]